MEGTKKIKSTLFHQYSWYSEVETTWISLISWHQKTSSTYAIKGYMYKNWSVSLWWWWWQDVIGGKLGHTVTSTVYTVLWCQPIKLIQVVSTSEYHEYWWNDVDFIFFWPLHLVQGLRSLKHWLLQKLSMKIFDQKFRFLIKK